MLLFNQIAGFFDHQYIWKECIDILDFLHEGIHEGKVASKPTTFGWVCPGKPSYAQICPEFLNAFCWSGYVDVKHISDWNINKSRRRVFFQHFKTQDFKLSTEITAWKVSKYGVFSGPYFPAFGLICRISPYSVRMRENTNQKKLRIWTLFMQWNVLSCYQIAGLQETISFFDCLHRDSYQRKKAPTTTTVSWVWAEVPT